MTSAARTILAAFGGGGIGYIIINMIHPFNQKLTSEIVGYKWTGEPVLAWRPGTVWAAIIIGAVLAISFSRSLHKKGDL